MEKEQCQFNSFSGPLTLTEIKKALSIKKSPQSIQRRASISDLNPSRNIFFEYPELYLWSKMNLSNGDDDVDLDSSVQVIHDPPIVVSPNISSSSKYIQQISEILQVSDSEKDTTCDNKSGILRLCSDSVIIISDDEESYEQLTTSLNSTQSSLFELKDSGFTNLGSTSTEDVKFNDTIEEMEKFLKEAATNSNETMSPIPPSTPLTKINTSNDKSDSFKKPLSKIPIVTKKNLVKKSPCVTKTPHYKDIVSPVAIYIKNSPHVPLIQNVPTKQLSQKNLFPSQKLPNNDNDWENLLPSVIYAPPRKIQSTSEPSLKLPINIHCHLPTTPRIIKHKGRLAGTNRLDVEEKLVDDGDLSLSVLSELDNTVPLQEISVHTCKELLMMPSKH
uniref:Uncharacterized protein n=1 Tax=Photinus pyralis TaxID=7054 RepID=A0A1Y1KYL2_PHOPY